MAAIETTARNRKRRGVATSKKLSTRVDLTPMVDLGFLLITFFIFTTTIAKPTAIRLVMPNDHNVVDSTRLPANRTLTLVVGENELFYYTGRFEGKLSNTTFSPNGLRDVIISNQEKVRRLYKANNLVVLIKVTDKASYKNLVTCLNEMLINSVSTYMLLDASSDETKAVSAVQTTSV
jgi:biopolymer transport protein ExbD